jgi:hypothetical protein
MKLDEISDGYTNDNLLFCFTTTSSPNLNQNVSPSFYTGQLSDFRFNNFTRKVRGATFAPGYRP